MLVCCPNQIFRTCAAPVGCALHHRENCQRTISLLLLSWKGPLSYWFVPNFQQLWIMHQYRTPLACTHTPTHACTHTHTHAHTQPFYSSLEFVLDNHNLGEPIQEETFTHSHLSWSSVIPCLLHPSIMIHGILHTICTHVTVCIICYSTHYDQSQTAQHCEDVFNT